MASDWWRNDRWRMTNEITHGWTPQLGFVRSANAQRRVRGRRRPPHTERIYFFFMALALPWVLCLGVLAVRVAISPWAAAGAFTLPPRIMSVALSFCP